MSHKRDFKNSTKLDPYKKNAIQLCGQEFVENLIAQKLYAKHEEFWYQVNQHLNIPDTEAEKAKENAERERLLQNKTVLYTRKKRDWEITVFELPDSDIFGKKYTAEAVKNSTTLTVSRIEKDNRLSTPQQAYQDICNTIGNSENQSRQQERYEQEKLERLRVFLEHYQVLKPIYLMFLYLSGWDEH